VASEIPPPVVNESVPTNDFESPPQSQEPLLVNEYEVPPVNESVPQNEFEAPPPVNESVPTNEFEVPPTNELEVPPPTNEYEAPPPTNEYEAPPVNESVPQNEYEAPPDESFGEQSTEVPAVEPSGEGESAEIEAFRNMMGTSPEAQQVYIYMNTNISTEENRDKSYKREGVLHFTDSVSVGANQTTVMSLGSVIGNRGIETTTYDKLRNVALQKVGILLGETRRCYNTKIDFERNGETILVHIYGTIYSKKSEQQIV